MLDRETRRAAHKDQQEDKMKSTVRCLSVFDSMHGIVRVGGILAMATVVTPSVTFGAKVVLDEVPAYDWYHGCAPTAAGSVFGYWDLNGFDNLFDASDWDAIRLTVNVQDQISSPARNAKYDPTPDNPFLPDPPDTSIADFMHTSEEWRSFGGTSPGYIRRGVEDYAEYRGYQFNCAWHWWDEVLTDVLRAEIDAGRPMLFGVDSDASGRGNSLIEVGDHIVPVFGYDDRGVDGFWYGFYTTWSEEENITWAKFNQQTRGTRWGVATIWHVRPEGGFPAVPEPNSGAAGLPFIISTIALVVCRKLIDPDLGKSMPARQIR
jgi:hypothetical protein